MANIFEVIDPRGFKVICTEEQWNNHIIGKRAWMKGWEQEIQKIISEPLMICQDPDFEDRNVYYRRPSRRRLYLKAIVLITKDLNGFIISAFPCDSCKSGEKLIWPN